MAKVTDIMLDIETMGQGNDAAIIAIGAVVVGGTDEFYREINLGSAIYQGGMVDRSTCEFWQKQPDRSILLMPGESIITALMAFNEWVMKFKDVRIWGKGSTFDNVIVRSAMQRCCITPAWDFRSDCCFRTVLKLFAHPNLLPKRDLKKEPEHNALGDARFQARQLSVILKRNR